ncbi:MAG TPA: GNAT family N-acetyltransferase [Bacteroidota bacterium]|nr:GNAT family N-acetyltransferase [Bacteroidota bacterium]
MKRLSNEERLRQLAEDFFDVKNDPQQLQVNDEVLQKLRQIHPLCICEEHTNDGPIAWTLVMPTTHTLMTQFLNKEISENELFQLNPFPYPYDALYLCSALVLPEYQRQGIAKRMLINSVSGIRKDYPIQSLFLWPFSEGGDKLAESVARTCGLPLFRRKE